MPRLEIRPGITGAFRFRGTSYPVESGVFTVKDGDVAAAIVHEHHNVTRLDDVPPKDEYPTNEEGEYLCVGKESGQCGRTVDEAGGKCWQHGP